MTRSIQLQKDIRIKIGNNILEQLKLCVENAYPNESCGLLFGVIEEIEYSGDFQYVFTSKRFHCIESDQKSPVAFLISNMEKMNEIFKTAAQKYNLRLISIFHSHPSGSYPSNVDYKNMKFLNGFSNKAFRNQIWLIMSARDHNLNGFIYYRDKLKQVIVDILES